LITNVWLEGRGGTESVVRDLALGFLARGHLPVVYSSTLGAPAYELREKGVPVLDDIRSVGEKPDVIHGQHIVQTAEAIIRFPDVPVVNVCHAWTFWVEAPVNFPQIQFHVAVDEACRERILHSGFANPERIVLLPNGVDLRRIPIRSRTLPPRPQRALAFTKTSSQLPVLQDVCARHGIQLDTLGYGVGRVVSQPEAELVNYDLVFATARCALEALCAGSAVVVCDGRGLASLVSMQNFHQLRNLNFGLRSLTQPVTPHLIEVEIGRYDPVDSANVSKIAREQASLDVVLDQFLALYRSAISRATSAPWDAKAHNAAVSSFLHEYLPRRPGDSRWPAHGERQQLLDQIAQCDKGLGQMNDALVRSQRERDDALTTWKEERDRRLAAENALRSAECKILEGIDQLAAERERATAADAVAETRIAAAEAETHAAEQRAQASESLLSAIQSSAVWRLANPVHKFIEARPGLHAALRRSRTAAAFVFGRRR
jgi:hypothetical protein